MHPDVFVTTKEQLVHVPTEVELPQVPSIAKVTDFIRRNGHDPRLAQERADLGRFAAGVFSTVGRELHVVAHIIGADRVEGRSPWGHGTDETVGVSMILRIASELVSASVDLFTDGRTYAAAALTRQLVEVEYLAWAFETRDEDAARWLRSDRDERNAFFKPAKLRQAAQGRFRGADYDYHCELGGHPIPRGAAALLGGEPGVGHLLLSDMLGHAGAVWDHAVGWARDKEHGGPVLARSQEMSLRFLAWKSRDPLLALPPSPTSQPDPPAGAHTRSSRTRSSRTRRARNRPGRRR